MAPGMYNEALGENFPIMMEPEVSLIGAGYTQTIISGNSLDYVIHFPGTVVFTESTVIEGFEITGGSEGIRVDGTTGDGIYNRNAHDAYKTYTVIQSNLISNNTSTGIYNYTDGDLAYANPIIEENQIVDNGGSGIYCDTSGGGGSQPTDWGHCSPTVTNNLISNNGGDGITCRSYYFGRCNAEIVGNVISYNQGWGIGRSHSGTYGPTSDSIFISNLIFGNTNGGATFRSDDRPTFVNSTIVDNNTYGVNGSATIVNSIVWGHSDDLNTSPANVSYSDIGEMTYEGWQNTISIDPLFVDAAQDNYHLQPCAQLFLTL